MLLQRLLTAAVGIPLLIALILIGGPVYTAAAALVVVLGALELYAITDPDLQEPSTTPLRRAARPFYQPRLPAAFGALACALLVTAAEGGLNELLGAFALAIAAAFLMAMTLGDTRVGLRDWSWIVPGIAYVGFFGAHFELLRDLPQGKEWVIVAVFGTFAADTFAYFVGRTVGRVHIAPRISPSKTVEGTAAGVIGGFAAVLLLKVITGLDVDWDEIVPLALLLPIAALIGDLSESLIKRGVGVKDTSELVPGHGGFLDRMDAVLFTTPLVYYFVIWAVL